MSINYWSPPAGGNSADILHPVSCNPMRGVGGNRDGGILFAHIFIYIYSATTGKGCPEACPRY